MDQRAAIRMPRRWKAVFGALAPSQAGFTQDISETGLFITASQLPAVGTQLVVKLETSSLASPVMACQVVRHVVVPPELRSVKRHGFGVRLLGDCAAMRELIRREQRARGQGPMSGPVAAVAAPVGHHVRFASQAEYVKARAEELSRGGLSFCTTEKVALNTMLEVTVTLGWTQRHHVVRGRCVHVRDGEGAAHVMVLLDDAAATLAALDGLARA
jgi:hypothetical protein